MDFPLIAACKGVVKEEADTLLNKAVLTLFREPKSQSK
jgi:hypothetical protein